MTYQIEFTSSARRDLHRLPTKAAFAVVEYLERALAGNPHRCGKPLANEMKGRYAARVGVHRITYQIDETVRVVLVVRIGYRGAIYRS